MFGHGEQSPRVIGAARSRQRSSNLLRRFLDPACHGVLFRTEYMRQLALGMISDQSDLSLRELEQFRRQSRVVCPAIPIERRPFSRPDACPWILYMGRDSVAKESGIAVRVFSRLDARLGRQARLVWVGPEPSARLPDRVERHPVLDRSDYLDLVRQTDVFFSPSRAESLGMGVLEAAALGAAVVASVGPGVEVMAELFDDGVTAALVPTDLSASERVCLFTERIEQLVTSPRLRTAMVQAAQAEAGTRLARRNDELLDVYDAASRAACRSNGNQVLRPNLNGPAELSHSSIDTELLVAAHQRLLGGSARTIFVSTPT